MRIKYLKILILIIIFGKAIYSRSVPYEYKGRVLKSTGSITKKPKADNNIFLIWDFNEGLQNKLGGWGNPFQSGECEVEIEYSKEIKRGNNGRSLKITANKKANCFCGFWFHLFDMKKLPKEFLDISDFGYLSFFVRGENGGEDFLIKVADENWVKKEDSVPVGMASDYIKEGGISDTEWREVVVPISEFKVDVKRFGQITFEFLNNGKNIVYIDDITLKKTKSDIVKKFGDEFISEEKPIEREIKRALWVWHPEDYQTDDGMKKLIKFCNEKNINVLWCQTLIRYYKITEEGESEVTDEELTKYGEKLNIIAKFVNPAADRKFLEYAHKNGIKEVHLLDGYKYYVLEQFHPKMLAQVKAVINFNHQAKDDYGKWDGVHHDNEPYLLDEFQNPSLRQKIYRQYLELAQKIKNIIKLSNSNLKYGVDIPFWFDEPDEAMNFVGNAKFNNEEKPVSFHLLDIVDNIGIMDYRNFAYGPDGIITHGKDEVEYATKVGKEVYVGVETIEIEPPKITFFGKNEEYLNKVLNQTIEYFKSYTGFAGVAIHHYRTYKDLCEKK
jgi:hypothetical protein